MANYKEYKKGSYTESDKLKDLNTQSEYWGNQALKEFQYDDFANSDRTVGYQNQYDNLVAPGDFSFAKQQGWDNIMNQILNREPFSYDVNGDALYQQYKDQYVTGGKMAMMDTMGQAAAMTGGYGNSYAQSVGQQAYQGYLQQLTDKIPELYSLALDKYNSEGEELYNRYGLYSDQYDKEYGQHRDSVADYQANRNHLADMITQSHGMDVDLYTANRDTALAENESANKIITDNRNYYADRAQQLADSEWGKYVDSESIAAKAIDMFNDTVYKNEQTRLAEAELAEKQRQYNTSLAESKEQNAKELAEQRRNNELNNTQPSTDADYATWDAMDWHYYFSWIRENEGQVEAEAELRAFNRDGFIPQEFQRVAASAVRGGNLGH